MLSSRHAADEKAKDEIRALQEALQEAKIELERVGGPLSLPGMC
jgi:hypothetical protein